MSRLATDKVIVDLIFELKKNDLEDKLTAAKIQEVLIERFPNQHIPEIRTIQNLIKDNGDKIKPSPEDKPWCLGATEIYATTNSRVIPFLAKLLESKGHLTIRRAKWITKLYPYLKWKDPPDETDMTRVFLIASVYSHREQISEINQLEYALTDDLDNIFLLDNKKTLEMPFEKIFEVWKNEYFPYISRDAKREDKKGQLESARAIETILGKKLSKDQQKLCNEFIFLLVESIYNPPTQKLVTSFIKDHPEIESLALKLLAFSTRKDLMTRYLEDKKLRDGE